MKIILVTIGQSVLSCSKTPEKIMYKRLFNHLSEHNLLYQKQFGFQQGHSTEHAVMQLIDQINDTFENNCTPSNSNF